MPKLKLLVFDDDPVLGNLIGEVAEKTGFETKVVTDRSHFERLYQSDTDLLVLDLEALGSLNTDYLRRGVGQAQRASIILISSLPELQLQQFAESAKSQGLPIMGTLVKPFTTAELTRLFHGAWLSLPTAGAGVSELVSKDDLRRGIAARELVAYFQPKVNPSTGELVGAEALARWSHPIRGLIMPGLFVPLAEKAELITPLFQMVADQAFAQCGEWKAQGLDLKLAINISVFNLNESELPDTLTALAAHHKIEPAQIVLEITESGLLRDTVTPLDVLARLAHQGIALSIDDFGTGYASIQQLQRIPFSELKIDRFFVHEAVKSHDSLVILESMFAMARKLGMRVVAEGVETQQHWDLLADLGCDQVQGYLVGRPMPGAALISWLDHWREHRGVLMAHAKNPTRPPTHGSNSQPRTEGSILQGWFLEGAFDGSGSVQRLPINQIPFRIGRQPGLNLRIVSDEISRAHAEIFRRGNHLVIRDLGSTNGTFVNHERVALEARLNAGDYIGFAQTRCRLIHNPENDDRPSEKLTSALFPSMTPKKPPD